MNLKLTVAILAIAVVPVCAQAQALAYVYFEDEPGRRSAAKLFTKDNVRRVVANIASCLIC